MYKKVLLKVSGEVFGGGKAGLDYPAIINVASQIASAADLKCDIGVVVGGGNIIRGVDADHYGIQRTTADYMGMLATIINSLALQAVLEDKFGLQTRVQSAIQVSQVAENFIRRRAIRHFEKGRIVIFAGGTGNPYFSTDTAAALRAIEINADIMLKATKVDGIYDKDPKKHPDAKKYDTLTYEEVLEKKITVMDTTAVTLCMENNLPIMVLDTFIPDNVKKAILGEKVGTLVYSAKNKK